MMAREIQEEHSRAIALDSLAPHLNAVQLGDALMIAREIQDERSRAIALSCLAPFMSEGHFSEMLAAASAIQDKSARADALSEIALILPSQEQASLLCQIFPTFIQSGGYNQSELVMKSWEKLDFEGLGHDLWNQGLHELAYQPRSKLLDDLAALLHLIKHLGGQAAVNEMFYSLRDVTKWWQ